ncbi:MAG: lytic transglycosylase domain-containing protein [Aestuariivirga sp.]|uniref:lytic transglycosylase domain-containing protein n=1 Tax=Aestuariivirga sp. TaxID=2650926 RepID=UPI003019FBF8
MRQRLTILAALLFLLPLAAGANTPPPLPQSEDDRKAFAETVCTEIDTRATEHGLPQSFIARLIWKESLFDPGAVSPKGAQGIAQFMPGTAKLRGLDDPFDAKKALAASTSYLAELRTTFGNLGLAAAAYNAGEDRVRKWLAGKGSLPYETQDYVYSITGHGHEDWKVETASFDIPALGKDGSFTDQCKSLVMRELSPQAVEVKQANWKPWGVVLTAGFSQARALQAFRVIRNRFDIIKDEDPLVVRKLNRSMGRRKMVRVMIGRDSRAEAQKLCRDLTARGGTCLVARN